MVWRSHPSGNIARLRHRARSRAPSDRRLYRRDSRTRETPESPAGVRLECSERRRHHGLAWDRMASRSGCGKKFLGKNAVSRQGSSGSCSLRARRPRRQTRATRSAPSRPCRCQSCLWLESGLGPVPRKRRPRRVQNRESASSCRGTPSACRQRHRDPCPRGLRVSLWVAVQATNVARLANFRPTSGPLHRNGSQKDLQLGSSALMRKG